MEDRTLFTVIRHDENDSLQSQVDIQSFDDAVALAIAIARLYQSKPEIGLLITKSLVAIFNDEELSKKMDESVVEMPDFNELLKQ